MSDVRLIALGNDAAGDDAAALMAARRLRDERLEGVEIVLAGRPGVGLLDLLDTTQQVVVVDVVRSGCNPGHIHQMRLSDVVERAGTYEPVSSHDLGPADAFRLAEALGRPLPDGLFVGIEGLRFELGTALSPPVELAVDELVAALRGALAAVRGG